MERRIFLFLCVFSISILLACASGHQEPFPESQEIIRDIGLVEERLLAAVRSSDKLSIQTIGTVEYGTFKAPVWLVRFTPGISRKRVLINGCIHGNEPAGVEVILKIIEMIAKNPLRYNAISFDFIPIVNPWGYSCDIRFNRNGRDVNRDFASFASQESVIVKRYVEGKRYDMMIDLHEDPDGKGFYMYQYAHSDTSLSRKIIETVRGMNYPIEKDINFIFLKTDDGLIDAPLWGLWYMWLTRQLSITNYYRLNNSELVYTFETPTSLQLKDRVIMQSTAVTMLIESL